MRFLSVALLCLASTVSGDLRAASQPRNQFQVRQRNQNVPFQTAAAIYMEPSDFNYQGLKQQRQGAYDNFLRSNIDNEQDKRNFNNEAGKDMLPFRSFETAANDASGTVQTKIPDTAPLGPAFTVNPGEKTLYPLRWNNPHASELEVNIWIMNIPGRQTPPNPIVVPIRRPTCSGEGHQDNVFSFVVPTNFNDLGNVIPGFTGCKKEGDCVLQVYAHSVEPRTYAIGIPLIVNGAVAPATATTLTIEKAKTDVGMDLGQLPRDTCLPSTDPRADIPVAVPREARLVSDVFNHAYQNSDYSPYSGQQPEAISRNLQASAIISMIPANQGELGKSILKQNVANFAANLRNKVDNLVKKYEGITNKIIAQVGDKQMKNTAQEGTNGIQKLETCFRCAEVGAVVAQRLTTNTYVPSFQLAGKALADAQKLVPNEYKGLISESGVVQIYQAVLNDLSNEFQRAATMGLVYQPAVIKANTATMNDPTQFRKRNAATNQNDNGQYAANLAQATKKAAAASVDQNIAKAKSGGQTTPLMGALSADGNVVLPDTEADDADKMADMDGYYTDAKCDNDAKPTEDCSGARPLFTQSADGDLQVVEESNSGASSTNITTPIIAAVAAGVAILALIGAGCFIKHRRSKQAQVTKVQTYQNTTLPVQNNNVHPNMARV